MLAAAWGSGVAEALRDCCAQPWSRAHVAWYRMCAYLLRCVTAARVTGGASGFPHGRIPPRVLERIRGAAIGQHASADSLGWNHSDILPVSVESEAELLESLDELYGDPLTITLQNAMFGSLRYPMWSARVTMEYYQNHVVQRRPCRTPMWPDGMPEHLVNLSHQHQESRTAIIMNRVYGQESHASGHPGSYRVGTVGCNATEHAT